MRSRALPLADPPPCALHELIVHSPVGPAGTRYLGAPAPTLSWKPSQLTQPPRSGGATWPRVSAFALAATESAPTRARPRLKSSRPRIVIDLTSSPSLFEAPEARSIWDPGCAPAKRP